MITPEQGLTSFERLTEEVAVLLAGADLGAPVPPCPGWTVADLVAHLGETHLWAEHCIRVGSPDAPEVAAPLTDQDALGVWYRDSARTLVDTLRLTPPETECWAFGPRPRTAAFWFRRQPHEVAVHRWDLGAALGRDLGYPAELAVDGVDEVVTMFFPRQVRLERIPRLTESLALEAEHGQRWLLAGDGTGDPVKSPDATVTGPAGALVLLLWGRLDLDDPRLTTTGSRSAATAVLSAGIVP
jgi:uncharacterized protein (TIGR03083 family)